MIVIDMDMPQNCTECPVFDHITGWCLISAVCPIKCDIEDIKAEIQAIEINGQVDASTMFIRSGEQIKNMALEIIDKHTKVEMESGE